MGFELVYCWKCSKRLTERDFEGGKALRVGIHTSCLKCAEDLLAQLPPDQRESILNPSKGSESATRRSSSRLAKPPTPRSVTAVRRQASSARPSSQITVIVGGVIAFAVLTGFLVAGSGNGSDSVPGKKVVRKERQIRPVTVKEKESPSVDTKTPPTGSESGLFVEPNRVKEAKEALQKAEKGANSSFPQVQVKKDGVGPAQPQEDILSFSDDLGVWAHKDFDPALTYEMARILHDYWEEMRGITGMARATFQDILFDLVVSDDMIHPGALKFLKEKGIR